MSQQAEALPWAAPLWEGKGCCSPLCLLERAALPDLPKTECSIRTTAPNPVKPLSFSSPLLLNFLKVNIWAFNLLVTFWWFPLVVMWEDRELGDNWICLLPLATYTSKVVCIAFLAKAQRLTTFNVQFQIDVNYFLLISQAMFDPLTAQ